MGKSYKYIRSVTNVRLAVNLSGRAIYKISFGSTCAASLGGVSDIMGSC